MADEELKSLPTKKFHGKQKFNVDGPQCQVCLTEYKTGDSLVNLPCKHEYHDKCIKEWLKVTRHKFTLCKDQRSIEHHH